jgi:hypothetical protein
VRTVQDLIDDLGRLDGPRFDETVFELFHRGPKALDRLSAYWESGASAETRNRIRASVQSQWTRIQEVLVNMAPRAFGSAGARFAVSMGPVDSLARRAQRCIEQGRPDTAVAIASALAASGSDGVDQAVLEARIAMAAGRPEQAMSRLGGYCQAPQFAWSSSVAGEWFARAAQDAGRSVEAFLSRLHLEPDMGAMSEIVMSLADAEDGPGLASCIEHVARSGQQALWVLLAESAAAALDDALGVHVGLVGDLLGMGSDIESLIDTVESVIADMEPLMPAPAERSMAAELVSLASDAYEMLMSARRLHLAVRGRTGEEGSGILETISSFLGVTDPPPRCDHDSQNRVWMWAYSKRPPQDALCRARLAALMHGASWRASWKNGEFVVSVSLSSLPSPTTAPLLASASALASGLDASAMERMLKSLPPQEAAEWLIHAIRSVQAHHARSLLDGACRTLREMTGALDAEGDMASDPSVALDGARRAVTKIRAEMERWSRHVAEASSSSDDGETVSEPPVAVTDEWSLPDELDCSPEAYQALRTAHLLIAGLGAEELLPPEQAELPAFLLQKAVQLEAERKLGDALAVHRLRPQALAATRDRGKRRRELDPGFVRDAVSRAPRGISPDRVRGGLERLFARVLDGSSRPLTGDLFLAGLALAYLDPIGDAERSAALGSALLAMGEAAATAATGDTPESGDLRRLEQAGIEALRAMSPFRGREGR